MSLLTQTGIEIEFQHLYLGKWSKEPKEIHFYNVLYFVLRSPRYNFIRDTVGY